MFQNFKHNGSDVNKATTPKAKAKATTSKAKAKATILKAKAKATTSKAKAKATTIKAKATYLKAKNTTVSTGFIPDN